MTQIGPITEPDGGVRQEPYSLPSGFTWDTLDPTILLVVGNLHRSTPIKPPHHVVHYTSVIQFTYWELEPWLTNLGVTTLVGSPDLYMGVAIDC